MGDGQADNKETQDGPLSHQQPFGCRGKHDLEVDLEIGPQTGPEWHKWVAAVVWPLMSFNPVVRHRRRVAVVVDVVEQQSTNQCVVLYAPRHQSFIHSSLHPHHFPLFSTPVIQRSSTLPLLLHTRLHDRPLPDLPV
ncbi:hypothetical protein NKR23_g6541 [Pleurostoma richardsiae]|uniref:Uncharacterized protein n=1 Tax=Pleurostoma richardsiae TaxID=41990 RepID=A0AA38RKC5_9PEZI|nr:hypothetical protein NKR23_g6541 [Pleurostoma richardsiae]